MAATDKLADVQQQVSKSARSRDDTLRRLNEMLRRRKQFKRKTRVLTSGPSKIFGTCNVAAVRLGSRLREAGTLEARIQILCEETDFSGILNRLSAT